MTGRKWLVGLVALALIAAALRVAAVGTAESVSGEATPLRFLTLGDVAAKSVNPENDRIILEINRRLGIKLKPEVVAEGGWEKINVAIASGDLPDVVVNSFPTAATKQWIQDGVIIALNPYFASMPTVKARCEAEPWTAVDGKYYGYPFITQKGATNSTISARGDWLKKLGLKAPATLEELYQTCVAFKTKDPDGNGKADTYGMTMEKPIGSWMWVFHAYGLPYADWSLDKSGNVIPRHEDPSFRPAMAWIKRIWDEGLVDPEFMLNDRGKAEEKWYQGRAGLGFFALFRHVSRLETNLKKITPAGELQYIDPPAGPQGKRGMAPDGKAGMLTAITSGSKNPKKAAAFVELLISPQGRELLTLGIEGTHFTRSGDKISYNEDERKKENFAANGWAHPLAWGHVTWPLESNYLPQTEPQRERAIESVQVATRNQVKNLVPIVSSSEIDLSGVVTEIYNRYFMDIMMGKIGLDAGIGELSKKWREQGGDKILAEVNAYVKAQKK